MLVRALDAGGLCVCACEKSKIQLIILSLLFIETPIIIKIQLVSELVNEVT